MLEWIKRFISDWVLINVDSFVKYLNKIPLNFAQKQIILLYFVPDAYGRVKEFKEIEHILNYSHDNVMKLYKKALKVILDNLGTTVF